MNPRPSRLFPSELGGFWIESSPFQNQPLSHKNSATTPTTGCWLNNTASPSSPTAITMGAGVRGIQCFCKPPNGFFAHAMDVQPPPPPEGAGRAGLARRLALGSTPPPLPPSLEGGVQLRGQKKLILDYLPTPWMSPPSLSFPQSGEQEATEKALEIINAWNHAFRQTAHPPAPHLLTHPPPPTVPYAIRFF